MAPSTANKHNFDFDDWGIEFPSVLANKIEAWGNFKFADLTFLGGGSAGEAYDIGDGRVIKFTDDKTEAEASQNLVRS